MIVVFVMLILQLVMIEMVTRDYRKQVLVFYELLSKKEYPEREVFIRILKEYHPIRKIVFSRKYKMK